MNYTPQQIATADQTLAGVTHQLGRLTALYTETDPVVVTDELAVVLLETLNATQLAVTLAVAVQKLAEAVGGSQAGTEAIDG